MTKKAITKTPSRRSRANRANAQKSTGPKTAKGQLIAKFNATKHGLLSKEIFRENDSPEVRAEYEQLLGNLRAGFNPADVIEDMLVERMAIAWWRLARVLRFELRATCSAITVEGDRAFVDEKTGPDLLEQILRDPEELAARLDRALAVISKCEEQIASRGHLEEFEVEALRAVPGDLYARCCALYSTVHLFMEIDSSEEVCIVCRKMSEEELNAARPNLQMWQRVCAVVARKPELRATLERPDLPDPAASDRILRYETTIERQFYRAMDQLERLQRRRSGEAISAPARLHISSEPD